MLYCCTVQNNVNFPRNGIDFKQSSIDSGRRNTSYYIQKLVVYICLIWSTENLVGDFPRANPAWKTDIELCQDWRSLLPSLSLETHRKRAISPRDGRG